MQEPVRVLIAADTLEDVRKLSEIFAHDADFAIVGSATPAGLDRLEPTAADVFVVRSKEAHILLPHPGIPVLWVGSPGARDKEGSGISAVLSPRATPAQIRAAAAALAVGLRVQDDGAGRRSEQSEFSFTEPLTDRELEVLNLVAEGFSNPQIARRLKVSRNTVKFHMSSIIAKLGASSRTDAVTIALRRGLIII